MHRDIDIINIIIWYLSYIIWYLSYINV